MALEAHQQIQIVEENDTRFHIEGPITRELDIDAVRKHRVSEGEVIGYKAPRDSHRFDEIAAAFPLIRVLWVDREIRQTVSSMLSLRIGDQSWATTFAPREISKYVHRSKDEDFKAIFERTKALNDAATKAVTLAALCWLVKREQRTLWEQRFGRHLLRIDYDMLVTEPDTAFRAILDFLALPWSHQVLDHSGSIANNARPGGADPERPIDTSSRSKWQSRLSRSDLDIIEDLEHSFARREEPDGVIRPNAKPCNKTSGSHKRDER